MNDKNTPSEMHVAYLDSVRGIAALTVLASHYVQSYELPCLSDSCSLVLDYSPLHIWWDGAAAVSLFFVLSGLVLSLKYFRHGRQPDLSQFSLARYFLARTCRIWFPYAFVLLVSALTYRWMKGQPVLLTVPPQNDWIPTMWGFSVDWADMFRESFLLSLPDTVVYLPHAWTLAIELQLSFLIPIALLLAKRSSFWLIFFVLFAIRPLGAPPFLFHFMLGVLIAQYHLDIRRAMLESVLLRRFALISGLFLYTAANSFSDYLSELAKWACSGLGASLILFYVMGSDRTQKYLSASWPRYVGRVSYSIYLNHLLVLIVFTPWFLSWFDASFDWFLMAWWVGLFANIGVTVFISSFSYRLVEVPSMSLGKKLAGAVTVKVAQRTLSPSGRGPG